MMLFIARLYFVRLPEKNQLFEPPLVLISLDNRRSTEVKKLVSVRK